MSAEHGWAVDHPDDLYVSNSFPIAGQCAYLYIWESVRMLCPRRAIPGDPWLCADHLVEYHAHPDRVTDRRVFPATPVTIPDKEQAK